MQILMGLAVLTAIVVSTPAWAEDKTTSGPYLCADDRTPAPSPDEIVAACSKVLDAHPTTQTRLNALVRRAEGYSMKGDDAHAVADFTQAAGDNRFFGFLGQRGTILEQNHDYVRAIADLKEATRLRPDYEIAWVNLAVAYLNSGDLAHGEETLKHATTLSDRDPVTHNALGHLYLARGDKTQALTEFNAAIAAAARAGPDEGYSLATGQAHTERAKLEFERGDTAAAIADLDAAVRLNPKDADVHNEACFRRAVANADLKRGEGECDAAVTLSKRKAKMLDSRAFLEAREGRW